MPARRPSVRLTTTGFGGLTIAMGLLLGLCWMLGGVTVDDTPADELLQLAALPVIVWAVWRLSEAAISITLVTAIMLVLAVIALPLWQLLPLPQSIGMSGAGRDAIAADLALAGVPVANAHASLSVLATERSLWSLLPAVALFLGALLLPRLSAWRMLQTVLVLVLASAAFAFFQLTLPDGSPLLLYHAWGRNFGGVFVNPNHQGNALALGAVISAAMYIDGRHRALDDGGYRHWMYAAACAACVVMVPLANGSAAVLLVLIGLVAVNLMLGAVEWKSFRRSRSMQLGVAATIVMAIVVLGSALAWKRVQEERRIFATTTLQISEQFVPLGTGVGTFVPIYAQYQNLQHARSETINHAHNEYVQWWLEGGVPALLVVVFGLGAFCWTGWQLLARTPSRRLRTMGGAAWVGLLLLLLHSLVDFPLRTTTLMATAGLLAGLLFNAVIASRQDSKDRRPRGDASQPA